MIAITILSLQLSTAIQGFVTLRVYKLYFINKTNFDIGCEARELIKNIYIIRL